MNTRICAVSLSLLAGACALAMPAVSHAGNVGYYTGCGYSGISGAITVAGHTPVAIATLDNTSLAPLDGLVLTCSSYSANAAVNTAVANGLELFLEVQHVFGSTPAELPGAPALSVSTYDTSGTCTLDANLAEGSPIASGPGGTLTNSSLDNTNYCSPMGYATSASLPAGAVRLLTTASPDQIATMSYTVGSGRVVFSISQFFHGLSGGPVAGTWPGVPAFHTNVIAWMMGNGGPATTCASEGYKGAQLTWCRNICENGLSGQVLDTWIHRWIQRYRVLPYCAVEQEQPPV